ncbi:hypothetical protein [Halioxenophilus sp. WMMB6]|uniref:hypothetical protein n=1 Tax=Halioxenophilus sp. WMMB6 TaxID=3073815 RepID=UPI00295F5A07|nr:hypothetical protein [Halioxenophilus sp. WMMB6]
MRPVKFLLLFLLVWPSRHLLASENENNVLVEKPPPASLLEMLADFGDVDDETFELIVFHGLDDYQKQQANRAQKEPSKRVEVEVEGEQ